jgi:hypothetical protein
MIFAICGLTVEGTGTERAGTFSIAASTAWARAAGEPDVAVAAHKNPAVSNRRVTTIRTPPAGFLMALTPDIPFLLCF